LNQLTSSAILCGWCAFEVSCCTSSAPAAQFRGFP